MLFALALSSIVVAWVGIVGWRWVLSRRAAEFAASEIRSTALDEQLMRRVVQEAISAQLLYEQEHRLAQLERMAEVSEAKRPKNAQPGAFDSEQRLIATTQRVHRAYHRLARPVPGGALAAIESMLSEVVDADA